MQPPTLEQFLEAAEREFSFLVEEWGFRQAPESGRNPFGILYERGDASISVEGIMWGVAAMVTVIVSRDGGTWRIPLWALARHRRPEDEPRPAPGQIAQLAQLANELRACGRESLEADLSGAWRRVEASAQASWNREQLRVERHRLVGPGLEAFRNGEYGTAARLLSAVTTGLSKSEHAKLGYALRKTGDENA